MKKPTTNITYRVDDCGLHYFAESSTLNISDIDGDELNIEGISITQLAQVFRNALCSNSPAINARVIKDWPDYYVNQLKEISDKLTELLEADTATVSDYIAWKGDKAKAKAEDEDK